MSVRATTALLCVVIFAATVRIAQAQLAGDVSSKNPKNVYDEATITPGRSGGAQAKNSEVRQRERRAQLNEEEAELDAAQARSEQERQAAQRRAVQARSSYLGYFQTGDFDSLPRLYQTDRISVLGSLDAGLAPFVAFDNAFDSPPGSVNAAFPGYANWVEAYMEPGVTATYHVARHVFLYGGVSYLESGTIGTDYSGSPHAWYGLPEQLYAGLRFTHLLGGGVTLDASYGQQNYVTGGGMLLANGATNGFDRGAGYLGPRTAWRQAGLLKAIDGEWSAQLFYLRPNEAPLLFDNTRLTGINVIWNPPGQLRLGAEYVYSSSDILTRNQMSTYELRARFHPFEHDPYLWLQADYAIQGKPYLSADGWMIQANYNFDRMWWKPLVNVGLYSMSGANPANALIWYGFDPLYFGGSVPQWLPGFALQTTLANTNLRDFDTSVTLWPWKQDSLQLNYLAANVSRVNAALLTVPPSTPPEPGGGIPNFGYGRELGASYTHNLSDALSVNPFYAFVWPGNGIAANYAAHGGAAHNWSFLGLSFTASYGK
ncbi:MAG: hypothetical protein JO190_05405 [Candidatus Eremiobacteraeota bacterium]|nr:hypothetical protein [Candidatus Eremiobacteraeota bacterium]